MVQSRWFSFWCGGRLQWVADQEGVRAYSKSIFRQEMSLRLTTSRLTFGLDRGHKMTTFCIDATFYQHPLANAHTFLTLRPVRTFAATFQCNKHQEKLLGDSPLKR
jgi:hypothetical protein